MDLSVSRNPVIFSLPLCLLLDYWTHRNLLSRPERCYILAHFIAYIASCGGMALPVKLCRATERKCCGLEAPSEGAMSPWSLYPARHETYEESHAQAFIV